MKGTQHITYYWSEIKINEIHSTKTRRAKNMVARMWNNKDA